MKLKTNTCSIYSADFDSPKGLNINTVSASAIGWFPQSRLWWRWACKVFFKECLWSAHGKGGKETGRTEGEAELECSLPAAQPAPRRTLELPELGWDAHVLITPNYHISLPLDIGLPRRVHDLNRGGSCIPDDSSSATRTTSLRLTGDLGGSSQSPAASGQLQLFKIFSVFA